MVERVASVCECSVDDMLQVGDHVKIHRHGTSIFVITAIDDGRGLIEALGNAPGKYPFSCNLASLVPAPGDDDSNGPEE